LENKIVSFDFSLEKFKKYGNSNPDGWGIGWYENSKPLIFKQPLATTDEDSKYDEYKREVKSDIILTHVRPGTHGSNAFENAHPFNYKNYIFAHNGIVEKAYIASKLKKEYKTLIQGQTDSEVYFYFIIQNIEEKNDIIEGIRSSIKIISQANNGGLNFLLSDGINFYAFRYSSYSSGYYTLYYLVRKFWSSPYLEYLSKETLLLIKSKDANLEQAVVFCSEKLTEENWQEIENGQLMVVNEKLVIDKHNILNK